MPAKKTTKATTVQSIDDMRAEVAKKQQDLSDAKRSHKSGELVNPRVLGATRKEIARLHTKIREQELKENT